jgi:hypothetical protein
MRTEFKAWMNQHGIARLTILLAMKWSLHQQYGIQKDVKALWDLLEEDYKWKAKLSVWALQDEMSAANLRYCETVQEYASMIQGYENNFNPSVEYSTSMMPNSEESCYVMHGIPNNHDLRYFTQLIYDKIDTMVDKPQEIVTKMKAHNMQLPQEDYLELAAMF